MRLEKSQFKLSQGSQTDWFCKVADLHIEIEIAGTVVGPDAKTLAVVERVLDLVEPLGRRARIALENILSEDHRSEAELELEYISFGPGDDSPGDLFTMNFVVVKLRGDVISGYGLYFAQFEVREVMAGEDLAPVAVGRGD